MKIDENGMCALSEEDCSYHTRAPKQKRTNADRIRAMTDEELAECIFSDLSECACPPFHGYGEGCAGYDSCISCWIDWLKEAEP